MARDLGDLMWGAVGDCAHSLDGLQPEPGTLADLRSRVRRGRVVRHVREAAVAIPVVVAVAAAGWFGVDRALQTPPADESPAPVQPTPTPDPTPTPEETGTPDESDELVLGDPIEEPGLPTYYAAPDGLLDHVGPGWALAGAAPRAALDRAPAAETVFVISPEGVRFAVARLEVTADGDGSWIEHVPVSWDGGPTAVVRETRHERDHTVYGYWGDYRTLDLTTGTLGSTTGGLEDDGFVDLVGPDGRAVSGAFDTKYLLTEPGGVVREVGYGVDGYVCEALAWYDAESLLAHCVEDDALEVDGMGSLVGHDAGLYRVWVDEVNPSVRLTDLDPQRGPWPAGSRGARVSDGVAAFPVWTSGDQDDACLQEVMAWTGNGFVTVRDAGPGGEFAAQVGGGGGRVFVEGSRVCGPDPAPNSLFAHDLAGGAPVEIFPAVDGAAGTVLNGWTVVP